MSGHRNWNELRTEMEAEDLRVEDDIRVAATGNWLASPSTD